jgi:hypothetical protein
MSSTSAHTTAYEAVQKGSGQSDPCPRRRLRLRNRTKESCPMTMIDPYNPCTAFSPSFETLNVAPSLNHPAALLNFFFNANHDGLCIVLRYVQLATACLLRCLHRICAVDSLSPTSASAFLPLAGFGFLYFTTLVGIFHKIWYLSRIACSFWQEHSPTKRTWLPKLTFIGHPSSVV